MYTKRKYMFREQRVVFLEKPRKLIAKSTEIAAENEIDARILKLEPKQIEALLTSLYSQLSWNPDTEERIGFNEGRYKLPSQTRIIQQVLVQLGYDIGYINKKGERKEGYNAVDGIYNSKMHKKSKTMLAVEQLQRDMGMDETDGLFGNKTALTLINKLERIEGREKRESLKKKVKILTERERKDLKIFEEARKIFGAPEKLSPYDQFVKMIEKIHGKKVAEDFRKLKNGNGKQNGIDIRLKKMNTTFETNIMETYKTNPEKLKLPLNHDLGRVFLNKKGTVYFSETPRMFNTYINHRVYKKAGNADLSYIIPEGNTAEEMAETVAFPAGESTIYKETNGNRLFDQAGNTAVQGTYGWYFPEGELSKTKKGTANPGKKVRSKSGRERLYFEKMESGKWESFWR